jgi:NAD+--asparagine ADP-ribosyltransferase
MFAIAREYNEEDDSYEFTDEEIKTFEERRNSRLSGKSKTYSWQEAKQKIIGVRSFN